MKSWNEIRKAATAFSKRWKTAFDEKSQAQSFLKEFFELFGIDTVTQATFEHRVKFADGSQGFVDMFWQGRILVEMKSKGKDLNAAYGQAMDYVRALERTGLSPSLPRAVVISDFQRFRFYDLTKDNALTEFKLADLRKYVTLFGFMIGAESEEIREQDPVNREAAEKMARLHDALKAIGYSGRELETYLVRLLFCLFAEDTSIFTPDQFSNFIAQHTAEDGSDLAIKIAELFQVLNTPPEKRLSTRSEVISAFPYVNGNLFGETLQIPAFSAEMRKALLDCGSLDWSKISPAIFGAMFQGVMDAKARHDLGAHYTSEENILKLIHPLFLDNLREEFDNICLTVGTAKCNKLTAFHDRLASLTFLDPACGCGNFLLIAYRELRRLEMDVLDELHKDDPAMVLDVTTLCKVTVSQFYGIEIEPFPSEIAKVALWLMDHLCNLEIADRFGQYFARIPIKASPHIVCTDALTFDWRELLTTNEIYHALNLIEAQPPKHFDYIFGNPPFLGFTFMSAEQKHDMLALFPKNKNLDFVCGWYKKANDIIQGTDTHCAFVSTNSITQGEQVAPLWKNLNAEIDFAYRTFKWSNEAKGQAAVHCVIIGFHAASSVDAIVSIASKGKSRSPSDAMGTIASTKAIFDGPTAIPATHINGYLIDAPDVIVESRNKPLCDVPKMVYGNKPTDGGNLIFTPEEKDAFLAAEPQAAPFVRPLIGAEEFINGKTRYCLWLVNAAPSLLRQCLKVLERIEAVRQMRLASKKEATRRKADTPALFDEIRQPESGNFIIVPCVSSEKRNYIPIGFLTSDVIVSNLVQIVPDATLYHFGVLTSRMHNAWMRAVAGRLKSDYRYSKDIVYNNFIWPNLSAKLTQRTQSSQSDTKSLRFSADSAFSASAPAGDNLGKPEEIYHALNLIVSPLQEKISAAAQEILDIRQRYLDADVSCSLATLYDPLTMPPELVKAHAKLDALVDKAYGCTFANDAERVVHLFNLYAEAVKAETDKKTLR